PVLAGQQAVALAQLVDRAMAGGPCHLWPVQRSIPSQGVDAHRDGQDSYLVLAGQDLDPVGVPEPEPLLRDGGDRVAVVVDLVLMVDEVPVGAQVVTSINIDLESV